MQRTNVSMKKSVILFTNIALVCICICSCNEHRKIKSMMTDFLKTEIVIPKDLECICSRTICPIALDSLKSAKFIIYYDSLDCSSCRIGRLSENFPLYAMADTSSFSVLTIFSPCPDELEEVRLKLMKANYSFPVFIDVNGSFMDNNGSIPADLRFHSFLIDSYNYPVFVGNPLMN